MLLAELDPVSTFAIASVVLALCLLVAFTIWNKANQKSKGSNSAGKWADASITRRKILGYSVLTMLVIVLAVGAVSIWLLYGAAFNQQQQRLVETASAQARLIEAVARFSQQDQEGSTSATISQVVDAHQRHSGLGETGEFTMARLEDNDMVFLLERRHKTESPSMRVSFSESPLAEPMRRALSGESGTTVAIDYRGETVLAAFEPVSEVNVGIVAKIDLAEIRQPFTRAAIAGLGASTLLILIGGMAMVWVNNPLIQQVEKRERNLDAIVTNAADGIFTLDCEGDVLSFNQAAESIFGYQANEIVGQTVANLIEGIDSRLKLAKLHGERKEEVGMRSNGEKFPIAVAVNPMDQTSSPIYVGIARDITDRKHAELAMQKAQHAAEEASERAVAASRSKSDFLSHMSHELRTPLNGILGYAQILERDKQISGLQRGHVNSIVNSGEHLLTLINDVLDLSKIEAGHLEVDPQPTNLHKLIESVGDIVSQRADSGGLDFKIEVSPEVPQNIITDAPKLRQILINLAGNAVKFTKQGSVTIRVSESPRDTLLMEVVDTGVGMSAEELEVIFDAFKQVEAGKQSGGTGLGLSISKRLAEALSGEIYVSSTLGHGSTFAVNIPLVEAGEEEATALVNDRGLYSRDFYLAHEQLVTLLVVDDRETNRNLLHTMLSETGFNVLLANDGIEALEILDSNSSNIDLVLMDVRMPRMNGVEATQKIRADNRLKDLKVIAVTASVFPDFREQATKSGFDDFLGKPFRADDLMQKIQHHLSLEFVSDNRKDTAPDIANRVMAEPSKLNAETLPADMADELKQALQIKNLTAIKALGKKLISQPETQQLGQRVTEYASAFDFAKLKELADQAGAIK